MSPRRCDACERIVTGDDDRNHAGWRHDAVAARIDILTILELEQQTPTSTSDPEVIEPVSRLQARLLADDSRRHVGDDFARDLADRSGRPTKQRLFLRILYQRFGLSERVHQRLGGVVTARPQAGGPTAAFRQPFDRDQVHLTASVAFDSRVEVGRGQGDQRPIYVVPSVTLTERLQHVTVGSSYAPGIDTSSHLQKHREVTGMPTVIKLLGLVHQISLTGSAHFVTSVKDGGGSHAKPATTQEA